MTMKNVRPIDANRFEDYLKIAFGKFDLHFLLVGALRSEPTLDYEPVRHGEWVECDYVKYDGHDECEHFPNAAWKCTNCCNAFKKELLWKRNFCPNCGAKMDGKEHGQ